MKKYIIITVIATAIITTGIILTIVNAQKNNKIEECTVKYNETALEAEMLNNKVENTVVVSNDVEPQNEVSAEQTKAILNEPKVESGAKSNIAVIILCAIAVIIAAIIVLFWNFIARRIMFYGTKLK